MRTYVVESDFWERLREKLKDFTNVQWLGVGAATSAALFFFLLIQTSQQRSVHREWSLQPYETKILNVGSSIMAKRSLHIEGNIKSTTIAVANRCPELVLVEEETTKKEIDVRHRSKQQHDFSLQPGSKVKFHLSNADGRIDVHVFSDWVDEKVFERRAPKGSSSAIFSATADVGQNIHYELEAKKVDTYVFLFEGKGGESATAEYDISRTNYDLDSMEDQSKSNSCSSEECNIHIHGGGKHCIALQSRNLTYDLKLNVDVRVNNHRFLMFVVSLVPLVVVLLYIKFGKQYPNQTYSSGGASRQFPGYELVGGESDLL